MKRLFTVVFLAFICLEIAFSQQMTARQGFLDLTTINFEQKKTCTLDGEWFFYWKELLPPSFFSSLEKPSDYPVSIISVPGPWNGHESTKGKVTPEGFGTYRLLVKVNPEIKRLAIKTLFMSTSVKIWVNGNLLIENGTVGTTPETTKEKYLPSVASFNPDENGMIDIVVQIANWKYRKGGMWSQILIGSESTIAQQRIQANSISMFLFGCLFIMALYHFGLYFFRRKDTSPLVFGFACLFVAIRTVLVMDMPLIQLFPSFPWDLQIKLEFLTIYFTVPLFPVLMRSLYPADVPSWYVRPVFILSVVFGMVTVFVPIFISNRFIIPYEICMVFMFLFGVFFLIRIVYRRRNESLFMLTGFLCIIVTTMNDIMYLNYIIESAILLPFGLLAFIFFQAISLSSRFSRSFSTSELLSEKLTAVNSSLSRFVPMEFLQFLNKKDITEVELGDQIQRRLTILFADIREFTSISETLDPKENFDFLNAYLQRMGPIIRSHGGIVDKYIGDAIMALFPGDTTDAINASIAIQKELISFNEERKQTGGKKIEVGIGIHFGEMMLGTIGEISRMETTVISDVVNLASRIQELTKRYNAKILVSEVIFKTVDCSSDLECRFIDQLLVKGKKEEVAIYEIIAGDIDHAEVKIKTRPLFEDGIILYHEKKYTEARSKFEAVSKENPHDRAAFIWIDRCGKVLSMGLPQ